MTTAVSVMQDADSEEFSKQQLRDLREAFDIFDKDKDGFITTDELWSVMRNLRQQASEDDIREMIHQVDIDGKGQVSFEVFYDWISGHRKQQSAEDEIREAFKVFDTDGDGFINAEDIKRTMGELGDILTDEDAQLMVTEADVDGDGRINFKEFIQMMTKRLALPGLSLEADAKYNPEQRAEFKIAFALFDKDRDGFITRAEVETVMQGLGQYINDEHFDGLFKEVDLDGNGKIDYDEFVKLLETRAERQPEQAELRQLFNAMDKDRSGYIDAVELKDTFISLGVRVTNKDVNQMMREAGVDTGRIYLEDFLNMMSGVIGQQTKKEEEEIKQETEERANMLMGDDGTGNDVVVEDSKAVKDMHVAFAMFDSDGDGVISSRELYNVVKELGFKTDTKTFEEMVRKVDLDGNGSIDFEEFQKLLKKEKHLKRLSRRESRAPEEEMRHAFSVFDKDGNGYVDGKELRSTMKQLGIELTEKDVKSMMTEAGVSKSGRIYYEEFVKIMFGQILQPFEEVPGNISDAQLKELKVAFSLFDKDRDGAITVNELKAVIKSLKIKISDTNINKLVDRYDYNGNGKLEFDEFLKMMTKENSKGQMRWNDTRPPTETEAWQAFKIFDVDADGFITAEEIGATMKSLGLKLTQDEIAIMIKETDMDGDGKINFHEFLRLYQGDFKKAMQALTQSGAATGGRKKKKTTEEEMKAAFDSFDTDKDGRIKAAELGMVMRSLGITFEPETLDEMIKNAGKQSNGTVDFNEFLKMMAQTWSRNSKSEETKKKVEEDEMRQAFKVFDIDGNGFIDAQELKLTMKNLGENLTDEDVEAMLNEADANKDGKIDYEEFIQMMYNK